MHYRIGFFIIGLHFFLNSVSHASDDAAAYEIFKQGLALEAQLKIYEARDRYIDALSAVPQDAGYLSHYAWFLTSYGFTQEAIEIFERLYGVTDDKATVSLGLGWNRQVLGQLSSSLESYKKRFPIKETDDIQAAFEQIRRHLYQKDSVEIESLKVKIASGIDSIANQKALLKVYLDQREFAKAVSLASDLLDQGALDLTAHLWLARALFWSGNKHRAEIEYRALIDASPRSAFLHVELAEVLISNNRLSEAKTALEKSLEIYPDASACLKLLAEVLAREGDDRNALAIAEAIPTEGNDRLVGLMARARAHHFSGHIQAARHQYDMVLKEYPYYADALWGMTETSIYSGHYGDAVRTTRQWENALPDTRLAEQKEKIMLYTAPIAETKVGFYSNASNFSRMDIGLEAGLYLDGDLRVSAGYHYSGFFQDGFDDVFRHTLFFDFRKYLGSDLQLDGRLSGLFYDNDHDSLNGELAMTYQATPSLTIRPHFRHVDIIDTVSPFENMVYSYVVTIGSVGMGIDSDELGLTLVYLPSQRFSLSGDYSFASISDGNQRQDVNFEAGYRFKLRPDWRIAYNFFYLDYRDPAPVYRQGDLFESAYWDPVDFKTHTLRVTFRHDNGKRFFYGAEGAISYIPESQGIGTYLSAFTEWRVKKNLMFRMDARWYYQDRGLDRISTTGHFWADNLLLKLDYRF